MTKWYYENEPQPIVDKYVHTIYGDTDSVAPNTIVHTSEGDMTIEQLFYRGEQLLHVSSQQHEVRSCELMIASYDAIRHQVTYKFPRGIYRHKTTKPRWRVHFNGAHISIDVTDDHSVMVLRNDVLMEAKPSEIKPDDMLIPFRDSWIPIDTTGVWKIEPGFEDEWVYDIDVSSDTPYFFANGILVHNSSYVSIEKIVGSENIQDKKAIQIGDDIGKVLNDTFVPFARELFLIPEERAKVLTAKRESIAPTMLFKKKKNYALHLIDKEKKRMDEVKIVGMATERSDTPAFIQDFLEGLIDNLLRKNATQKELTLGIEAFREEFRARDPWTLGSPGRVNNLTPLTREWDAYMEAQQQGRFAEKPQLHINVRSAINTNMLIRHYGENRWDAINDGDKIEVLSLKQNPFSIESVAIPSGATYVPDWFKELPFDVRKMEQKLIDQKVKVTISEIFGWDLKPIPHMGHEVFQEEEW